MKSSNVWRTFLLHSIAHLLMRNAGVRLEKWTGIPQTEREPKRDPNDRKGSLRAKENSNLGDFRSMLISTFP